MLGPMLNTWTCETKERTGGRRSAPAGIILFPPDLASKEEQAQLWVVTRIPKKPVPSLHPTTQGETWTWGGISPCTSSKARGVLNRTTLAAHTGEGAVGAHCG